jgi:hypothetical protein
MERGITDKRMDTLDFLDARFIRALGMRKTSR